MNELYDNFKNAIIQIVTPWGGGTGFYLHEHNLIITNSHVTSTAKEVVISGSNFTKSIAPILYSDPLYDLAFIEAPADIKTSKIDLGDSDKVFEGDKIIAIGHPYGLKFTATQGIISKAKRNFDGRDYIQIDAAINPGNSGGPLIDIDQKIIGINTFIIADGVNLGFALPVNSLLQALKDYEPHRGKFALRCPSCSNIATIDEVKNYYCPSCGDKIPKEELDGKKYIPTSTGEKVEEIISKLNYDVRITRVGYNFWEIEDGSANIKISYNEESNYVMAYAVLCQLPKQNIGPIYEYMLKENDHIKGLSFSVMQQDIILSMMHIHEEDLHIESGLELFKSLINKANHYDDLLLKMGALPLNKED